MMKKYFLITFVFASLLLISSAFAESSLTISYQVLDSEVRPGGETTVFLTLTNPSKAEAVRNIRLYISSGPYVVPSENYLEMGNLAASASQQTSIKIKINSTASSTISYLAVKANYFTDSTSQESTVNIPITVKRISILQISNARYREKIIESGNTVKLLFDLINNGDGSAKDVRISLNQTGKLFVTDTGEAFLPEIKPSGLETLSFILTIDPSVSIGTYSIPVFLTYSDETKTSTYSVVKYIGLTVSGSYNFIVALDSQDVIVSGGTGSATIKIANAGTQDAQFLSIKVLESEDFEQVTPSIAYVGKLSSGEYDTEKFTIKTNKLNNPGTYPIPLQLDYKDSYGNSYKETFDVNMRISSQEELAKKSFFPFLIVIIILIIVLIVWIVFKLMKKK